jgi:hypothetical protein
MRSLYQSLREHLCGQFCAYYKPSKKEDLVCEGFVVIEKFLRRGREIAFHRPEAVYDYKTQGMLTQTLCTVCPFSQNDCDFILSIRSPAYNEERPKKPLPCGGFILLTHLLKKNSITIDDIRDII